MFREGQPADTLGLLIEGLIQVFTVEDGRETTILILRPNTWFATEAVVGDTRLLTSGRAITPLSIGRVSAPVARRLFDSDDKFAKAITSGIQLIYRDTVRELKNQRAKTSLQRLAAWILAMAQQSHTAGEVELPYEKVLLAARLGMTPETLSRDLAKLNPFGVEVEGRRLKIKNPSVLRRVTSFDELSGPPVP